MENYNSIVRYKKYKDYAASGRLSRFFEGRVANALSYFLVRQVLKLSNHASVRHLSENMGAYVSKNSFESKVFFYNVLPEILGVLENTGKADTAFLMSSDKKADILVTAFSESLTSAALTLPVPPEPEKTKKAKRGHRRDVRPQMISLSDVPDLLGDRKLVTTYGVEEELYGLPNPIVNEIETFNRVSGVEWVVGYDGTDRTR